MFRIGFGYDVHQLVENRELWIGGVKIPYTKGSLGHSDGDALIHAICDALFGAANLRDIGYHFPDTSQEFKNIDSKILLKKTIKIIYDAGYNVVNIDSTVCLQKPKLKDYIEAMKEVLSETMQIPLDCVSVKATTTENLGFVGKGEGIAVNAVVLIQKIKH